MRTPHPTRIQPLVLLALVAATLLTTGCVRRRLTIRSNPPGALVYVDDYEIGTTPCSTGFTYYGTRQIRLVKDGYETLTVYEPLKVPTYQIPPLDFISETMTTKEYRDERTLSYQLQPQVIVPSEILQVRAEQLRIQAHTPDPTLSGGLPGTTNTILGSPNLTPPGMLPDPGRPVIAPPLPITPGGPIPETLPPGGQAPLFAPPLPQ